jgi:hypothetical protein
MFGVISRRLVSGGALLLTAFLAADAANIDDPLHPRTRQLSTDAGAEQPLEPALKRALLESGAAFEELVKAAKDWEAAHRD